MCSLVIDPPQVSTDADAKGGGRGLAEGEGDGSIDNRNLPFRFEAHAQREREEKKVAESTRLGKRCYEEGDSFCFCRSYSVGW